MSGSVSFTIPSRIGGKGRGRVSTRGGRIRVITPEKTRNTEAMLRSIGAKAMGTRAPIEGPLSVDLRIFRQTPTSWSKRKRAEAFWITGKPDADNTIKLLDALNGVVWKDDAQISAIHFERQYRDGEQERIEVIVTPLSNNHPLFGTSYSSDAQSPSLSARNTK